MHERAAVTRELNQLMADSGGAVSRVVAVVGPDVDLGVVTGIWDEIVAGTPASTAELVCEAAYDMIRCIVCGTDYPGSKLDRCPECLGDGLVIEQAPEFEVTSWMGAS